MTKKKASTTNARRDSESKHFFIELYTEWENLSNLINSMCLYSVHYAFMLHDRDVYEEGENAGQYKKPHIHLYLEMPTRRTIEGFYKLFASIEPSFRSNLIQHVGNVNKVLRYLTHIDNPEKTQYAFESVATDDIEWYSENYQFIKSANRYLQDIEDFIHSSKQYLELYDVARVCRNDFHMYSIYSKKTAYINTLIAEHNRNYGYLKQIEDVAQKTRQQEATKIAKENSLIAHLTDTFDTVTVHDDFTDSDIKIMAIDTKKGNK